MYAIEYANKTSGVIMVECCFNSYLDKRRLALDEQEDIVVHRYVRLTGIGAFFACMFHKRYQVGYLPSEPKGKYRI